METNKSPLSAEIMKNFEFNMADPLSTDNVAAAYRYLHVRNVGGEKLSEWVFAIALKCNNPELPVIAAEEFEATMAAIVAEFHQISVEKFGFVADADTFSFTGNSAFANVFKRIKGAMALGGDLSKPECSSPSKCQTWTTKTKKEQSEQNLMASKRASLGLLAQRAGHEEGSEEYNKYVEQGMAIHRPVLAAAKDTKQSELDTQLPTDEFQDFANKIAEQLRDLARYDANAIASIEQGITDKVRVALDKAVKDFAAKALQTQTA